jgi:hypothetical protein
MMEVALHPRPHGERLESISDFQMALTCEEDKESKGKKKIRTERQLHHTTVRGKIRDHQWTIQEWTSDSAVFARIQHTSGTDLSSTKGYIAVVGERGG